MEVSEPCDDPAISLKGDSDEIQNNCAGTRTVPAWSFFARFERSHLHPLIIRGANATVGEGISDTGEIVGAYAVGGVGNGFILSHGTYKTLDFPGSLSTDATGISSNGAEIVGGTQLTIDSTEIGFLFDKGTFTLIQFPGSTYTTAFKVNASGETVGTYNLAPTNSEFTDQGYTYKNGVYETLDFPGAAGTFLGGINNRGEIVGTYIKSYGVDQGFIDKGGVFTTINFPGATDTSLIDVSNSGEIIGLDSTSGPDGSTGSFLLSKAGFTSIASVSNGSFYVQGINDQGQFVGGCSEGLCRKTRAKQPKTLYAVCF